MKAGAGIRVQEPHQLYELISNGSRRTIVGVSWFKGRWEPITSSWEGIYLGEVNINTGSYDGLGIYWKYLLGFAADALCSMIRRSQVLFDNMQLLKMKF